MDGSAAQRHSSRQPVIEHYLEVGFNYRMTDVQAAIGLVQLGKLGTMVARRRALARRYRQLLADVPGLATTGDPEHGATNYQSFWVLLPAGVPGRRGSRSGLSARLPWRRPDERRRGMRHARAAGGTLADVASRALGWSFVSNLTARLGTLGIGIVLARLLGPHAFGTFAVAFVAL